jgi:restriction system protein
MLPVLRQFEQGATNVAACVPPIKQQFGITDEEAQELIPSGTATLLYNRVHWARTYLAKAGLLESPRRNVHVITERGRLLLAQNPARIDNATLEQFQDFHTWRELSKTGSPKAGEQQEDSAAAVIESSQTPEDALEAASNLLNATLRDDLLSNLLEMSPQRFERLILDLLNAMGYGGGNIESGSMTKATGDGGIDGIINEDALGLDAVYIQAKRYAPDNTVGRPDIQRFVGSLTGESATKGVFVTTSDFSREARDFVQRVQQRIVLINGKQLSQLLVNHNVGVRLRTTYAIKAVDEDYFTEPDQG